MQLSPSEFWRMTPWQFKQAIKAYEMRRQYEHNQAAWAMWHNALLTSQHKIPPLARFLHEEPKKAVKVIDENAIMIRFDKYQAARDNKKNG